MRSWWLPVLVVAACDADSSSRRDGGADATAPADGTSPAETEPPSDAPEGEDGPAAIDDPTVELLLLPVDFFTETGVPGLEVCSLDFPELPCVTSTEEGARMLVPAAVDQSFTIRSPDHLATLYPLPGRNDPLRFAFPVFTHQLGDFIARLAGTVLDPERSQLLVFVTDTGSNGSARVIGAVVSIEGDEGVGPFYLETDYSLHRDELGTREVGAAVVLNLPGDHVRVTVSHPERDCFVHGPGWPLDGLSLATSELPLLPGHVTHLQVRCPPDR